MKPNFALDLSHDGIGLVHRGKGGWVLVGEVSLEHPDLASGLNLLRRKAADLESGGFSCKLIIPGSQLLFTSMTAPGPDDDTRMARIREGLEGLTPYAVGDLVFDWRTDPDEDGMVHVAVVARETLDEAEAFATEHNLNPVSFVARPSGSFVGEAFFGAVKDSGGAKAERDNAPVPELLGTIAEKSQPRPAGADDRPAAKKTVKDPNAPLPELAPFPPTPDTPAPAAPPRAKQPVKSDVPPAGKAADRPLSSDADMPDNAEPVQGAEPPATPGASRPPKDAPAAPAVSTPGTTVSGIVPPPPPPASSSPDAPTFSSRRAEEPAPDNKMPDPVDIDVKPRLSFGVERPAADGKTPPAPPPPDPPVQKPVHVPVTAPMAFGDDPALSSDPTARKPSAARTDGKPTETLVTAARKSAAGLATAADVAGKFGRKAAQKIEDRRRERSSQPDAARPKVTIPKLRKGQQPGNADISVTAITPPPQTSGMDQPVKPSKSARARSPRAREAETMTVFGARQTQAVGGKPKYLGLFLVLGLLLLMAIVAIWSMFFLNDSTAWLFPQREDPFEAAITTDLDDIAQESAMDDLNAALDSDVEPEDPGADTLSVAGARDPLTAEAAQARYAATGIWQRAPDPLSSPPTTDLDDLYIASIDPETTVQDAVALPNAKASNTTAAPINTAPPPPLGTTFTLDSDGLVVPTPDGALSPDGILVYAGQPPLVPAPRPGSDTPVPAAEETVNAAPALPAIRPRARPDGLIEGNERLQLGGRTRTELAVLRPRVRPTTPRAAAQAAAIVAALDADLDENAAAGNPSTAAVIAPTEQAIATSREPRHRPSGFSRIVAKSAAASNDASDGSVAVAAAAPQESVTPSIPTRASVANQATIKNAINLRKISLIGIYGSSSSRRALVRLPSGRYQKVGVGSRLDGGQVVSISASALVYKKGSRSYTLEVLPFS